MLFIIKELVKQNVMKSYVRNYILLNEVVLIYTYEGTIIVDTIKIKRFQVIRRLLEVIRRLLLSSSFLPYVIAIDNLQQFIIYYTIKNKWTD